MPANAQVYEKVFSFSFAHDTTNRGSTPRCDLIQGSDGNFYGTTFVGGANDLGTVFKVTSEGAVTVLVDFTGNGATNRGSLPYGGLVQGSDGYFYGTTSGGGTNGFGTVYKMSPAGVLTTLVDFTNDGSENKGYSPAASLVQGDDGDFYGTTEFGGAHFGGTVFKVSSSGKLTTLVEFTDNGLENRGSIPAAKLIQGRNGNFYGTTLAGGTNENGTAFEMTPDGVLTTLVEFTNLPLHEFVGPFGSLLETADGSLYGTTYHGGAEDWGTVFKITPDRMLQTLVEFTYSGEMNRGALPQCGLVQDSEGYLYGTTSQGGTFGYGTIFKMTTDGLLVTLADFTFDGETNAGGYPLAGLLQSQSGSFYGTTSEGGTTGLNSNAGTLFRITSSGALTTVTSFTGNITINGSGPYGSLNQATDGNLYGTTSLGGLGDVGTVFKLSPIGALTSLVSFSSNGNQNRGNSPLSGLLGDPDGLFYGTTVIGGNNNLGTVFQITPAGDLTTLIDFSGDGDEYKGRAPEAELIRTSDGNLYGTTIGGGANG